MIPTISPLSFLEHTPETWQAFVRSLKDPVVVKPEAMAKLKITKTGKVSLSVPKTREPKWVLLSELEKLAKENGRSIAEVYIEAKKKKVMIIKNKGEKK